MITSESSQGVNLITVLNYDEYSGNAGWDTSKDTSKDTTKDTSITHSIKDLQELGTQPKTQLRTQPETQPPKTTEKGRNLGHSRDTKLNKEEESNNIYTKKEDSKKEDNSYELSKKETSTSSPAPTENSFFDSEIFDSGLNTVSGQERKSCAKKKEVADAVLLADKREQEFSESLKQYADKYDAQMLRDFFDYWTERNKSRTTMRFEKQTTWDLSRRLARWDRNNGKYTNYGREKQQRFGATPPDDFTGKGSTKL